MTVADVSSVPMRARIEGILSASYGIPVHVRSVDRVQPWSVSRCHLAADSPEVPASVVVKWLRDNPNDARRDPAQLSAEQAALEFLADVRAPLSPRLLAADTVPGNLRSGILVLEDLSPREPLRAILLREGQQRAGPLLLGYARALGRLHSLTLGRADTYYTRRRKLGPVDPQADIEQFVGACGAGVQHMDHAGAAMTATASHELAGALTELTNPGPFLAFSNGDPGVNNYLVDSDGDGRLIDFEAAGYRHALSDLVNDLYLPGSMWLTVSDPTTNGIEKMYRNTLAPFVHEVTDDRVYGRIIAGAAFVFAASRLSSLPKMDIRPYGHQGRLHRIATLEAAAHTANRHQCLPQLTGWARTAADVLRRRWPDVDIDLNTLADYTPRE